MGNSTGVYNPTLDSQIEALVKTTPKVLRVPIRSGALKEVFIMGRTLYLVTHDKLTQFNLTYDVNGWKEVGSYKGWYVYKAKKGYR